jgi:ATP-dependent DNA helicase RecQ
MIDSILKNRGEFDVSTYDLSRDHDVRPLVVNTLLTYLELADVIEATAPFYSEYQFAPLKSSAEILARFDPERAAFLKSMFACAVKGVKWFRLDLASTIERLQTTRERNDVSRVRQVLALAEGSGCLVRRVLGYFGEEMKRDCGHCGPCLGESHAAAPLRAEGRSPALDHGAIAALRRDHPRALSSARKVARFLCGLTSPQLTQRKLTKHPLFGSQAETPFHSVMAAAEGE